MMKLIFSLTLFFHTAPLLLADGAQGNTTAPAPAQKEAPHTDEDPSADKDSPRLFHYVLDQLLNELAYDLKTGTLKNVKNLAIRKIDVSEVIPATYRVYLKNLVTEKVQDNTQIKMIQCIPCENRTSKIIDKKIVITSQKSDVIALRQSADLLEIDHFMDVVLIYHTTHMVLGVQVFNSQSQKLVWTKNYNSETIKSRFQSLAVDYSQVMKSRQSDEYTPEYRFLIGLGSAYLPNLGGEVFDDIMLGTEFRAGERFDNRQSEFGLLFDFYVTTAMLAKNYPLNSQSKTKIVTESSSVSPLAPYKMAISLSAFYAYNFLGTVEVYDRIRSGVHFSLGAFAATDYFTGTGRVGLDLFLGRRWAATFALVGIAPSTILVSSKPYSTSAGAGGQISFSYNY